MVQGTNLQQTKRFVNPLQLYITCEKSGGPHLTEPGLTAGRLADKIRVGLEILKALAVDPNI